MVKSWRASDCTRSTRSSHLRCDGAIVNPAASSWSRCFVARVRSSSAVSTIITCTKYYLHKIRISIDRQQCHLFKECFHLLSLQHLQHPQHILKCLTYWNVWHANSTGPVKVQHLHELKPYISQAQIFLRTYIQIHKNILVKPVRKRSTTHVLVIPPVSVPSSPRKST